MPRKRARQKRNRKKPLKLSAMLRKFDEMENTLEHSLMGINSEDDDSCSSSAGSLTQTQNLNGIGELRCGKMEERESENINGKNFNGVGTSGLVSSKSASDSENTAKTALNGSVVNDSSDSDADPTTSVDDSYIQQCSKSAINSEVNLSDVELANSENTSPVTCAEKFASHKNSESVLKPAKEDSIYLKNLDTVNSENTVKTALNDSVVNDSSDSDADPTTSVDNSSVQQCSKSAVDSEIILLDMELTNSENISLVTCAKKFATRKNSESVLKPVKEDSIHLKNLDPVNSENIISEATVDDTDIKKASKFSSSELLGFETTADSVNISSISNLTENENSGLKIPLNNSPDCKDSKQAHPENIISEVTVDAHTSKDSEVVGSEILGSEITSDNVNTSRNSDFAKIENFNLNVPHSDSLICKNSEPANSEIMVPKVNTDDSHVIIDPEFSSSKILGCETVMNNTYFSQNLNAEIGNRCSNVSSSDSPICKNSESLMVSESDSIISADDSRLSNYSGSFHSQNTSLKRNKKRKRGSCASNELFNESSGFVSESSVYHTPTLHESQSSFYDIKFYSNLSEIFETPLSSCTSKPCQISETPLSSRSAKSSSRLSGESGPNLSRSFPCYTPLFGEFDLFSSSEPVLRNQSSQFKSSSCSSSHITSLLKEKNYSVDPFVLSSNSDIEDRREIENFSNGSSLDFLDQSFNKENERSVPKKRGKRKVLKRDNRKIHNLLVYSQLDSKSSSLLDDNECATKDSAVSFNEFSSPDLFLSVSQNERSSKESNVVTWEEGRDQPDCHPSSAVSSLPFTPFSQKESGFLRSVEFQQNSGTEVEDRALSPSPALKKDQSKNDHSLKFASKFKDFKDRSDFGTSTPKADVPFHSGTSTFSVPPPVPSLSLHQIAEFCKRITSERLPNLGSPPRWPIDLPFSRVVNLGIGVLSWIWEKTARGMWILRAKVSRHSEVDLSNGHRSQVGLAGQNVPSLPTKLNPCCSCQCLVSVMPKLISKIETLDSDIQQIKSLLVQKVHVSSTFGGPPAPPPPPPPPPPPMSLLTPVSIKLKHSDKPKQDCKKKDEMTRPPITVEDLRRVTLRKTPLPQNKERKISTDPRCPVVSLEMLRSVKLRPRRRIIDSRGSHSIRSLLSKSSRERSDIIDCILNPIEDIASDAKADLVDSDVEENPSKKSRTEVQNEKEVSPQQT